MRRKKILVAMSGGVDSSLAAAILKKKGHDVIGATMKLWPKEECLKEFGSKACCSLEGIDDARRVARQLKIPHYVFDLYKEFKSEVIDYFCRQYVSGLTPNPCIVCNQKVKFGRLLKKARQLGCDFIATGHYAKVGYDRMTNRYFIAEGRDKKRDQSYFLAFLSQEALARTIFPLENLTKNESRRLAKNFKLNVHNKKSSQEVCFIRSHYSDFIGIGGNVFKEGDILNLEGEKIGRHKGIHLYTIGQRKRLGIPHKEPLYVTGIDKKKNTITVGTKKGVMKRILTAKDPCWGSIEGLKKRLRVMCKIRYGHEKSAAIVENGEGGRLKVSFYKPQEAPTPGQAAVFYRGSRVLCGGWIDSVME